jgi:MFS family permease
MSIAAAREGAAGVVLRALVPLAAAFFLTSYLRSVNAVLSPYLIADLHLDAGALGLLTSVYFFTSAAFQLPLGLFMDRYGPRRVQGWLMLLAAAGIFMFALGESLGLMALGRAIMGIGAAGALMTCFQAVVLWFPRARWPALNGWIMAAGGLGGLAASLPTSLALHFTDWRGLMLGTGAAGIAISLAIFTSVPERADEAEVPGFGEQLVSLASIYRDRLFWRLSPVLAAAAGSNLAFGGLWAGPWLKDVAGLTPDGIGVSLLAFSALTIVGFVVSGNVAAWLARRGVSLLRVVGIAFFVSLLAQSPLLWHDGSGRWIVFCGVGAFSGITALAYPVLNAHFPPSMSGRVNTAINLFFFCGAFALQSALGAVIDLFPQVAAGRYPVEAYRVAFALMIGIEVVTFLWFLVPVRARTPAPAP